jgi:hypothetical protein
MTYWNNCLLTWNWQEPKLTTFHLLNTKMNHL